MDSWIRILVSPNHYTGWGQKLLVLTNLAWNEKMSSLLSFHSSWNIIPYNPILSQVEYSFKKKLWLWSHPTPGGKQEIYWYTERIIRKWKVKIKEKKSSTIEKWVKKKQYKNLEIKYELKAKLHHITSTRGMGFQSAHHLQSGCL